MWFCFWTLLAQTSLACREKAFESHDLFLPFLLWGVLDQDFNMLASSSPPRPSASTVRCRLGRNEKLEKKITFLPARKQASVQDALFNGGSAFVHTFIRNLHLEQVSTRSHTGESFRTPFLFLQLHFSYTMTNKSIDFYALDLQCYSKFGVVLKMVACMFCFHFDRVLLIRDRL